jgi:hypothetical protein
MFDLDRFIIRSHEKIIGHYLWLLDTATSDQERARFQKCVADEQEALARFLDQRWPERERRAA